MREQAAWLGVQRCGRVALVRLRQLAPSPEDLEQLTRFLDTSHRECQAPLLLLGIPALGLSPPSEELRRHILSNIKQRFAQGVIEQAFLVIPTGNFFKRALLRSLFTGVRLTLGLHKRAFLFETLEEAVQELAARHGVSAPEILAAAKGLIAQDPAASANRSGSPPFEPAAKRL